MKKSFVVTALFLLLLALPAFADSPNKGALALPIGGNFIDAAGGTGTFAGTFNLQKFAVVNDHLVGQGILTGTMTASTGTVLGSVWKQVALPVSFPGTSLAGLDKSSSSVGSIAVTATCDILHLDLGPLNLDLLGLNVNLQQVVLDITAQSGPGNLLGNLLCAITNLLNGGLNLSGLLTQIAGLLNQILGILNGLGL